MSNESERTNIEQVLEALIDVLQIFRDQSPRISVAQIQATLLTALETMDTKQGERLPTVSDYAERLKLSASGASRLMSNLSSMNDGAMAPLVKSDRGPGVARSEAFVLTDAGRAIVANALEMITGCSIGSLDTHDFVSFAIARHGAVGNEDFEVERLGPKTYLVSPRQNALSPTIREWCIETGILPPKTKIVPEGVEMEFATTGDAFKFGLRWN